MAPAPASIATPGQLLGPAHNYLPGPGTHIHQDQLFSSLLGVVAVSHPAKAPGPGKRLTKITPVPQPAAGDTRPTISVTRTALSSSSSSSSAAAAAEATATASRGGGGAGKREVLPEVGNRVLCRVIRITPRQAVVAILVCGDTVLDADWQGLIRVQDVRATEKDRVKIYESFRPGDVVRAEVISLGDQANYYLSTARNELGVIMATSEAGNTMVPVSWKEYRDPETGLAEPRKVAKP